MTENGLAFAKKVGIVAGTLLAVISLSNVLGGCAIRVLVLPEIERVVREEREARVKADMKLATAIAGLSSDRVQILAIMGERDQRQRIRMLRLLRNHKTTAE